MNLSAPNYIHCKKCEAWSDCVFTDVEPAELDILFQSKACHHYEKHQVIFAANTKPLGVYCIKNGLLKLTSDSAHPAHQQILHIAKKGEILGVGAVLLGGLLHYNAETIEASELCLIDKETFLGLLEKSPKLCQFLLIRTSKRLMERDLTISRMSHASVRERVAHTLLLLETAHGKKTKSGMKLDLSLSREEIAQLTGTVHESVVRVLSDFKKEGLIRLNKREITILNEAALKKIYSPSMAVFGVKT